MRVELYISIWKKRWILSEIDILFAWLFVYDFVLVGLAPVALMRCDCSLGMTSGWSLSSDCHVRIIKPLLSAASLVSYRNGLTYCNLKVGKN